MINVSTNIVLQYFGDDKKKPAGVLLVGQTMNSWPYVNPGFRIFYLDKKTYHVLDYDQYFIDLDNALSAYCLPNCVLLLCRNNICKLYIMKVMLLLWKLQNKCAFTKIHLTWVIYSKESI